VCVGSRYLQGQPVHVDELERRVYSGLAEQYGDMPELWDLLSERVFGSRDSTLPFILRLVSRV
jgi:hypothetical protein